MRAATKPRHAPTKMTAEPAHLWVPDFITFDHFELNIFTNVLRDSDATQVYLLLREYSDFVSGEFNGCYHNLMALCTPPRPERGLRRPGPSYQQVRRIINDLINVGLVQRVDATQNQLQGQLRLQLTHVFRKAAPIELHNRVSNRVEKRKKSIESTTCEPKPADSQQDIQHGYQGVNTSFNSSNDSELSTTAMGITRPPEGAQNGPHEPVIGQVDASHLMAANLAPELLTPQPPLHEGEQQPATSSEGGISAARAALAENRKWLAERKAIPEKQRYAASKPMPSGLKPSRINRVTPPADLNKPSGGWIGDLL